MIIAHYPGSGGHRYGLFLKKLPFDTPGVSMHQPDFSCHDYRYLTVDTSQNEKFDPVLIKHTHTLNNDLLEKFFLGHEIVKIKADLKKSLSREWRVAMKYYYDKHPIEDQIGQMFDMIVWHHNYYAEYPVDWKIDTVIDIDTDCTEFGQVMRKELDASDPLFDLAWDCFIKFGSDAPIIDLYKEYERQNCE
jgi:hypothetical protein